MSEVRKEAMTPKDPSKEASEINKRNCPACYGSGKQSLINGDRVSCPVCSKVLSESEKLFNQLKEIDICFNFSDEEAKEAIDLIAAAIAEKDRKIEYLELKIKGSDMACDDYKRLFSQLKVENEGLRKKLEGAREALKPFGSEDNGHYEMVMSENCSNCGDRWPCDFQRAKEALRQMEEK